MSVKADLISARGHMRIAVDYLTKAIKETIKQEKKNAYETPTRYEAADGQAACPAEDAGRETARDAGPRQEDVQHQDVD